MYATSEAGRGLFNNYMKSEPVKFRKACLAAEKEKVAQDSLLKGQLSDADLFQKMMQQFISSHWKKSSEKEQVTQFLKAEIAQEIEHWKNGHEDLKKPQTWGLNNILITAIAGHFQETGQESAQRKKLQEEGRVKYDEFLRAVKGGKNDAAKKAAVQALQNLEKDYTPLDQQLLACSEKEDAAGLPLYASKNKWDFKKHAVKARKKEKWLAFREQERIFECGRAKRDLAVLEVTQFVKKLFGSKEYEAVETYLFQRAFEGTLIDCDRAVKVPLTSKQAYIHFMDGDEKILTNLKSIFEDLLPERV